MEVRALERVLVEEGEKEEDVIKGERRGRKRVLESVVRKVGVVVRRRRRRLIPDDQSPTVIISLADKGVEVEMELDLIR
jgi:hypothetical protein